MRILVALALILAFAAPLHASPRLDVLPGGGRPRAERGGLAPTCEIDVRYEPGLEHTARELQAGAEQALDRISEDLVDLPAPRAIHVQLVRDAESLAEVAPEGRGAPKWAIGVAYPDLGVISVAMRRGPTLADPLSTLRHELAHIALGAALGARAPHWLHEGFAYQHSGEWSWERSETLAGMAWFGGIVPLDDLDHSFPAEESPANRAYAESYDFVGYLSRRGRYEDTADDGDRWPFRVFLTSIGQGRDIDSAAIRAFGKPLHALFDEWSEDLSKRYLLAPVGLMGLAVWILCAFLLAIAWWRRRRHNKRRIAEWDREERQHDDLARQTAVVAPPYVPWPGEDPLEDDHDEDRPDAPKLMN